MQMAVQGMLHVTTIWPELSVQGTGNCPVHC
jgi:hypothetical protein